MRLQSLLFAFRSQMRIGPEELAVSIEFRPVVVPVFGAVLRFRNIVIALAVSAEVEEFVRRSRRCRRLQVLDVVAEAFPKGFRRIRIRWIRTRDEPEIMFGLKNLCRQNRHAEQT